VILLRKILFPFSLIYAFVVRLRNFLYDTGVKKTTKFSTKTICIGNLSTGGTGKTPMVEYLIRQLQSDYKMAILSRGYKRKSSGFVLANEKSTVASLGDEPFQIHTKFPKVTVAVDENRRNGIHRLEESVKPDLILLDDAFQHRKVTLGLHILLTAHDNLYCDDWYLPTGNLRDSKREAQRADLIVVTKCPPALSEMAQHKIYKRLKPNSNQQVLFSTLEYDSLFYGKTEKLSLSDLKEKKVTLVTGIANPKPLTSHLETIGLTFEHLSYADHHFFSASEIKALNEKELVLTTEKDYMRLKNEVANLFYIVVKHKFLGQHAAAIAQTVTSFMKQGV